MTTVETTDVKVVETVASTVDGCGVRVAAMIVVGTVVVGVTVELTITVVVDVLPGASQLQNSLTRVLAMFSKLASRDVQSVVVAARFSLTDVVMVVKSSVETVVDVVMVAIAVVEVETSVVIRQDKRSLLKEPPSHTTFDGHCSCHRGCQSRSRAC